MELIPGLPNDIALQCLIRVPRKDFPSISSVCRSWKALLHLPHFSNHRKLSGFSRRVIIMAQDRSVQTGNQGLMKNSDELCRLTLYEPQTGKWSKLPSIPAEYGVGLHMYYQVAAVGYNVVLMGGKNLFTRRGSPTVFIYNFVSGTWRRGSNMPGQPRYLFACASDNKRTVFVAGGFYDDMNALKSALSYDVENDEWTTLADMAGEKAECKGLFQQGKFHVTGGYNPKGGNGYARYRKSAQVFDVKKWAWDEVVEDFMKEVDLFSTLHTYAIIPYVIGEDGKMYMCHPYSRKVGILGEGVGEFQVIATVPRKKVRFPRYMIEYDGNLLVMGKATNRFESEACVLDLKSSVWTKVERPFEYSTRIYSHCCLEI